MDVVDLVPLVQYPELSSYNSCFSYFGRSILPPLISSNREELNTFREKAILIESRIKKHKEEKNQKEELLGIVQEAIDAVIDIQNNENQTINQNDNSSIGECKTNFEESALAAKTNLGSNIYYEEVVHDSDDSKDNENITMLKCNVNGWMSDSEVVTKLSSNHLKPLPIFTIGDSNQYPCSESDLPTSSNQSTDLDKYLDTSIEYEHVSSVSSSSGKSPDIPDTVISIGESVETLDHSSRTITPKNSLNENLDSVDCLKNTPSVIVRELEPTDCFSLTENKTSTFNSNHKTWLSKVLSKSLPSKDVSKSVNDLVRDNSVSPPARLVRSNSYTLDSPSPVLVMSHLGCQCANCSASATAPRCHSITSKHELSGEVCSINKSGNLLDNVSYRDNKNLSTSKSDPSPTATKESENFTADEVFSRSPLVKSKSFNSFYVNAPENNSHVSVSSENEVFCERPISSNDENSIDKMSSENSKEVEVANELYNKFVEIREKTLMDLKLDQLKQLEAVKVKFDKKEKELREKLSTLSSSSSRESRSSSKIVTLTPTSTARESTEYSPSTLSFHKTSEQFSPTISYSSELMGQSSFNSPCSRSYSESQLSNASYHAGQFEQLPHTALSERYRRSSSNDESSPISKMRSYIANNNMLAQQSRKAIEEIINTPEMQKKFEKVTALAKGFLTRRLWKSHRVQGLMNGIKMAAQEMAEINESIIEGGREDNPTEEDLKKRNEVFERVSYMDSMLAYIFFDMGAKERMAIIAETRKMEQRPENYTVPLSVFTQGTNAPSPNASIKKHKLSSATVKYLERKKHSCQDSKNFKVQATKKPLHERTHLRRNCTRNGTNLLWMVLNHLLNLCVIAVLLLLCY